MMSFSFQHVLYTYMVFLNATMRQKKHPFLVGYNCNQRRNYIDLESFKFVEAVFRGFQESHSSTK